MDRRAFVLHAVGAALPLAAMAQTTQPSSQPHRGFKVATGSGHEGESFRLFDRSWIDFKVNAAATGGACLMIEQRELRRFGPPRHVHHAQDEWFYPLRGTYRVEVGEDRFEIAPGDLLFAPRGVPHVWMHNEDEPGGMLVAFHPAGRMESFFREFTGYAALPSMDELRVLFRRHGMEITGPPLSRGPGRP